MDTPKRKTNAELTQELEATEWKLQNARFELTNRALKDTTALRRLKQTRSRLLTQLNAQ